MVKNQRMTDAPRRCLGLREAVTITTGTVIGVGLFTVGGNVVGGMGPAVILATLAALAVSVYPALLYAEMSAALPFSGGTYVYAAHGLGRPCGMLAGWSFIISMVAVASGEALAFSFYIRTLFDTLGVPLPVPDAAIAFGAVALFLALGARGVELSGRMQNGFMFFFWGVALVWLCSMLPVLRFDSFAAPLFPDARSFLPNAALVWWCFAGFETCCAMGEEFRHPQITLPRALILAPFIVFAVNGLFQWVLLCAVPPETLSALAESAAPYAEGMRAAGVVGFPLVLLCLGIAFGGDFSTLNACVNAPARYLYTMSRDGALPPFLQKLHPRFGTPVRAILLLGAVMLALVLTNSVEHIASLSLFATLLYYILGIGAACGLRRRHPELPRPCRAPWIALGAPVSAALYLLMITQLDRSAVLAGIAWSAAGLLLYLFYGRRHYRAPETDFSPLPPPEPPERAKLDREFHRWRAAVVCAVLLVATLYLIAFLLG